MTDTAVKPLPRIARLLPPTMYYGWAVAVGCSFLMLVGVGVGYYGLAVFLRPLQEVHGWSNAVVSGATGLYFSLSGITGAIVGPHIDRRGPKAFMLVGSLLIGAMVSLIGYVDEVWQLFAVYGLLAIAFGLATSVSVSAVMTRWFVARRAQAMSISSTGISVGGMILAPLGSKLIDIGGLELATPLMGLLVVAVAVPVILFVIVADPAEVGLPPDGLSPAPIAATGRASLADSVQRRVWTRATAARTSAFWVLLVAFGIVLTAQTGFVIHQISFLETRVGSRSTAALALSVTAFGSIVARLVVGSFADRIDKKALTVFLFVLQAAAVLGVVVTSNVALTYLLTLVFGFTIGNVYLMMSLLVGEVFGTVSFGAVFGLVTLVGQTGSGIGPFLVGALEDRTGGYATPFASTALATLLAAVVVAVLRPPAPA
ncbi:MAG TPA: MFS transporter [Acidimicrobiales bacterium]|nr:MFS transporter [Acidimicrobiales bacterium]